MRRHREEHRRHAQAEEEHDEPVVFVIVVVVGELEDEVENLEPHGRRVNRHPDPSSRCTAAVSVISPGPCNSA
jgi:hypothetical protein